MKALQIIATLTIASSFSLYSMDKASNEKKIAQFTAIKGVKFDKLWFSCSVLPWGKKNQDCIMVNAYLLLNRFPNNSVEEQIKYYEKLVLETTEQIDRSHGKNSQPPKFLEERKLYQESKVAEIQKANLSGKIQDKEIQEKFTTSFDNIVKPRFQPARLYKWQLKRLNERIEFQQFLGTRFPNIINNSKN